MHIAKQSTAATLIVGPILDSTGAEFTTAVIGDLSIAKHDASTLTALASAATLTHLANGQYALVLTTGNTDTLGRVSITCNKSTYQMAAKELMIVPATVYDAIVTNATNATGGLLAATAAVTGIAGVLLSTTNDPLISTSGTATAGGASTISLQSNAVSSTDYYKSQAIVLTGGTGVGQTNRITAQAALVCTVQDAWKVQPDNTTTYKIIGRIG